MAIKVGINGFGRIGRVVLRIMMERPETFDICGINLRKADVDYMVYMIKYDSVFRQFTGTVEREDQNLIVNGHRIRVFSEADAAMIPWESCGAEYVIESTGAAKAVGRVIPALKGKMTGMSFRVPTSDVSVVDLTAHLKTSTTYADICYAIRHASETYMKGIIGYTADQVVSADLIANPCPCIFDETAGIMLDDDFVKLIAWYDNEYGYSNMVVRLLEHMVAVDSGLIVPEKREVPQDAPSGK